MIQNLFCQDPKIYFTVLGRKIVTWVGQDIFVNGLYVGEKNGTTWNRYGWKNGISFGIAVDKKTKGKNIFLACGNGVMRSTDYGTSWKIVTNWEITEVQKVYIDPNESKTVYLTSSYGIWKSADYGDTWIKKNAGLKLTSQTYVTSLVILPSDSKILYGGTSNGIVNSTNGGDTWQTQALNGAEIHDIQFSPLDEKCLVCCTENEGIYISKDAGKTWRQINNGLKSTTIYSIAFDPVNKGTIYCGGFVSGLYKTTDYGEKWVKMENEISEKSIHTIAVYPNDPNFIFIGALDYGVFRSIDGGKSFNCVGECDGRIWHLVIE